MSKTIYELAADLDAGRVSAVQLAEQALAKLKETQAEYNIVTELVEERALERARDIDARRAAGESVGRLAGIPFVAKDNFLAFGAHTTAASNILRPFMAPYQATAIERLEAEGAVLVAKVNLDSFGHGASTENSDFGPTKNSADTTRVAGGSSGGSAVAVALGAVPFALGTDTGGSTRQPASFNGVIGHKPTYGSVSRYGVVAMASSTDTIGTLAQNIDDAALVFDCMAGKDERDSTTLPERPQSFLPSDNKLQKKLKIGLVKEYMGDALAEDVRKQVMQRVDDLRKLGHEVEEVSLPSLNLSLAIYYIVIPAEVSSNLARYDGVKYGLSAKEAKALDDVYGLSRDQGFNAENKRRILIGTYVLSSGYYDAYYRKAQTARTILINEFNKAFEQYDVLVGPVAPSTAFKLGENTEDPLKMYLADLMTVAPSLAGLPATSVPSGMGDNDLPVGLQVIGKQRSDALLFALAKQLEEVQ
ncbi:MAG TPA: Asp-tRNA(Asn)/Glu-tRNA(Gln) amidotransferase subunit GatA [Candidatus Saccharimonadales bacterium]|nr:Asp-tRNA(Asn)/Glu-tRNA(Gln) amidotransferase subunit GatA [Candidatus Saccharimonadales bacterium]